MTSKYHFHAPPPPTTHHFVNLLFDLQKKKKTHRKRRSMDISPTVLPLPLSHNLQLSPLATISKVNYLELVLRVQSNGLLVLPVRWSIDNTPATVYHAQASARTVFVRIVQNDMSIIILFYCFISLDCVHGGSGYVCVWMFWDIACETG